MSSIFHTFRKVNIACAIALSLLVQVVQVKGQTQNQITFPVDARFFTSPPYSPYVTDYGMSGRTQISLRLSDPLKTNYSVKIGIRITGTGYSAYTKVTSYKSRELLINNLVTLTPEEVADLFNPIHLEQTGLPVDNRFVDGSYTFSVEVFDANDVSLKVSNPVVGQQILLVTLAKAPFLNLPLNGAKVDAMPVQNVTFQWTPRHMQVFNPSGLPLVYELKVVELIGETDLVAVASQAQNAVDFSGWSSHSVPVSRTGLMFPYYQLTQVDFRLKEGAIYAWQVTVSVPVNSQNPSAQYFENNGQSGVYVFQYQSKCPRVAGASLSSNVNGINELYWPSPYSSAIESNIVGYQIMYRPTDGTGAWQNINFQPAGYTQSNTYLMNVLDPNKFYDVDIKTVCTNANFSDQVHVGSVKNIPVSCSEGPKQIVVTDGPNPGAGEKKITWEKVAGAQYYFIDKQVSGNYVPLNGTLQEITSTDYTFIPLAATDYRISAHCSNGDKAGAVFSNVNGYQGTCSVPVPLSFQATQTVPPVAPSTQAGYTVSWQGAGFYQGYAFNYREKGSPTWISSGVNTTDVAKPFVSLTLTVNKEYEYQIDFTCTALKQVQTQIATFLAQSSTAQTVDPVTGDCFPPTHALSEVKTTTSVQLSWDKMAGASGYIVYYTLASSTVPNIELWSNVSTTSPKVKLDQGLTASSVYKYVIKAKCSAVLNSIASEQFTFDLSKVPDIDGACTTVNKDNILATATTQNEITLGWPKGATHTSYQVRYHDTEDPVTLWHTKSVTEVPETTSATVSAIISNLKAGRTYEVEIQPFCLLKKADKSQIKTFSTTTTPAVTTQDDFSCGAPDNTVPPNLNDCGKKALKQGMTFTAAGFEIVVDQTPPTAAPINYTGPFSFGQRTNATGTLLLPYANYAEAYVKLVNVEIDTNRRLCRGQVQLTHLQVTPLGEDLTNQINAYRQKIATGIKTAAQVVDNAQNLLDETNKYITGGSNVGSVKTGNGPEIDLESNAVTQTSNITNNNGAITVGSTSLTAPAVILGNNNTIYQADASGGVHKVATKRDTLSNGEKTPNFSKGTVVFSQKQGGKFDFDAWQPAFRGKLRAEQEYELISNNSQDYRVASQFIRPKEYTEVVATVTGSLVASNITFVSRKGLKFEASRDGNVYTVKLVGGPSGDAQEIFAIYEDASVSPAVKYTVGKLLLPAYGRKTLNLVLVPVGTGTTASVTNMKMAIESQLATTYGRVGFDYNVTVGEAFDEKVGGFAVWDLNQDNKLQDKNSSVFSNNYTGEERALVQSYLNKVGNSTNAETAYLFMLNETVINDKTSDLRGKMPHQEQFGFVFMGSGTTSQTLPATEIARTVAHELGHGAHFLDHTHIDYLKLDDKDRCNAEPVLRPGNIMSYCGGDKLYKYQWDQLYDPGHVWGIFKREKDAQNIEILSSLPPMPVELANEDGTFTFITPAGTYITLPKDVYKPIFKYGEYSFSEVGVCTGALLGFTIRTVNGVGQYEYTDYKAAYDGVGVFSGYYKNGLSEYVNIDITKNTYENSVIMAFPFSATSYKVVKLEAPSNLTKYTNAVADVLDEYHFPVIPFKNSTIQAFKEFTNTKSILSDKQYSISPTYIPMLAGHEDKPEFLMMLKLIQLRTIYPSVFDNFSKQFDKWSSSTLCAAGTAKGTFETRYCSSGDPDHSVYATQYPKFINNTDKYEFYKFFWDELKEVIVDARATTVAVLSNILPSTSVFTLKNALELASDDELRTGLNTLHTLPEGYTSKAFARIIALSVLSVPQNIVTNDVPEDQEDQIVRLLKNTPVGSEADQILKGLMEPDRADHPPLGSPKILAYQLFDVTDDATLGLGKNNLLGLMQGYTIVANRSTTFRNACNAITQEEFDKYVVPFKYDPWYNIFNRELTVATEDRETHKVTIANITTGVNYFSIDYSYTAPTLFSPIWLENKSTKSYFLEGIASARGGWVPAIAVAYADKRASWETAGSMANTLLDAVGIASGYTELKTAYSAYRRALIWVDLYSSGFSLANNLSDKALFAASPALNDLVNGMNAITVGLQLTKARTNPVLNGNTKPDFKEVVKNTTDGSTELQPFMPDVNKVLDGVNSPNVSLDDFSTFDIKDRAQINGYLSFFKVEAEKIGDAATLAKANSGLQRMVRYSALASYPNIRKQLGQIQPILKNKGLDPYVFESVLAASEASILQKIEANSNALVYEAGKLTPTSTVGDVTTILQNVSKAGQWSTKGYNKVYDWIKALSSSDQERIEVILNGWGTPLLAKMDGALGSFAGLSSELTLHDELLSYFKKVNESQGSLFGAGAITKRTSQGFQHVVKDQPNFNAYINAQSVPANNINKRLANLTYVDETIIGDLGNLFDDFMGEAVRDAWNSGNFKDLPSAVGSRLALLKNDYELIVQAKVSINGVNPVPDFLFVKKIKLAGNTTLDLTQCIYIDNKILWSTDFTDAQKQIVNNVTQSSGATVTTRQEYSLGNGIVLPDGSNLIIVKVETFNVNDVLDIVKTDKKP